MNRRLQALVDQMPHPAMIFSEERDAVHWNRACRDLFREVGDGAPGRLNWSPAECHLDGTVFRVLTFNHGRPDERTRALSERLVEAREGERLSLSRDVHDGVVQSIFASRVVLEQLMRKVPGNSEDYQHLSMLDDCLIEANREGRKLLEELRPADVETLGLTGAVVSLLDRIRESSGLELELETDLSHALSLSPAVRSNFYRVVQECIRNVIKHSGASRARVTLGESTEEAWVRVEDWGRGFDPRDTAQIGTHIGLTSMRERAQLLGGRFRIESVPGQSTLVEVRIPLADGGGIGFSELKDRARALLAKRPPEPQEVALVSQLSVEEVGGLLHELQVHQLELEIQNEELRGTQVELEAARDGYRDLYEHAPTGQVVIDSRGSIVSANLTFGCMVARPRRELVGRPLASLILSESAPLGLTEATHEVKMSRADSTGWFWAQIEARPTHTSDLRLTIRDVSELRLALQQRNSLRFQLESSRQRQRADLRLSKEFQELIQEVNDCAAQLDVESRLDESLRPYVDRLAAAGQRAASSWKLALPVHDTGEQPIVLDELLQQLLPSLLAQTGTRNFQFRPGSEGMGFLADPALLGILTGNLIENAAQATASNQGRVTLSTGITRHRARTMGYLEVADTGVGMDEGTLAQAFKPFSESEAERKGRGLTEVLEIARRHHGEVHTLSEPGQGTTVRVILPLADLPAPA